MASKQKHSIEELVEQWAKEQLKGIKIYTKNDFINSQIEKALKTAPSKKGGKGPNYPDIKCMIPTAEGDIPVMIEVKGMEDALIKIDEETGLPDNETKKGEPNFANISKYAVNGAVHYANAVVRHTTYKEVIAIGVNGYEEETGNIIYEVSAWFLSRQNLFIPKEIGRYSDLSFLLTAYQQELLKQLAEINLTEAEIEQQKSKLEDDIERKLKDLNQKMQDELHIVVNQRVQLVTGLIMAGLGVKNEDGTFKVHPLQEDELRGNTDAENNDGAVIMGRIKSYLKNKSLPEEKIDMIYGILKVVFLNSHLEVPVNGESKLKTLYCDIKADIIPFLTGELHNLDFTGRLFNVLNAWVAVPDGAENDVVLTPRSVTELMAKLCQVNKDSYVWDFATGSAGFLISAMHQMIADAKAKIVDPDKRKKKILHIKTEQLLGIEKLADIYLLAVLNMILMKDGSANIIQGDSLTDFRGNYEQGKLKGKPFPADVFLLNPPYSAAGKGFVFVKRALNMMTHKGMAAVLIQENAGSGNGLPYTKDILKNNTLVASIKMPIDLFIGKSSVQTAIYVFEVGKPHTKESVVKFIDFTEDGYSRMNRRHSSQSVNLRDTNNARERYAEVVRLVIYGKGVNNENLNYFKGSYLEDHISLNGKDWTYGQHKKIETIPTEEDFRKVVKDYLAWRVSEVIKQEDSLGKQ
ncbi:MAG: N-6 DNA methylase [Bacteroidaceae bacterium]|nr:N-6 DNA methylase [Bacteroidaceae bacterium]